MQERGGEDRPQVADAAGVDPAVAVQALWSSELITSTSHINATIADQQHEPLDRLTLTCWGLCGIGWRASRPRARSLAPRPCYRTASDRRRFRWPWRRRAASCAERQRHLGALRAAPARARTPRACGRRRRAGPSPSTVSGIGVGEVAGVAGAPARHARRSAGRAARGAPRAARGAPRSESIPGHSRSIRASSRDAVELGRNRAPAPRRTPPAGGRACRRSARPAAGHDVERLAGAHHGRHDAQLLGPARVVERGDRARRRAASASSALRPWSGALPECAARPVASTCSVPAALRAHDHALVAVGGQRSPASKHRQAS